MAKTPTSHRLESAANQFLDNLSMLEDFISTVEPILTDVKRYLNPADKPYYALLSTALTSLLNENEIPESSSARFESKFGDSVTVQIEQADDRRHFTINLAGSNPTHAENLKRALLTGVQMVRRPTHLRRSSLISLVSFAELHFATLLHYHYEKHESAIDTKEKVLSLKELSDFGSIADARQYLVERKVDNAIRGSFKDWIDALRNQLTLSMSYVTPWQEEIIEVFQRRNLLVHAGGIINRTYTTHVSEKFTKDVKVGDHIDVSAEYLSSAISLFRRFFILALVEYWKNREPDNAIRGELLLRVIRNAIDSRRWNEVESFCTFILNDKKISERNRLSAQIKFWHAKKCQGQFGSERNQVETTDFSGKDIEFRIAKYALLDDAEPFCRELPSAIAAGVVSIARVQSESLYESVRTSPVFEQWLKRHEGNDKTASPTQVSTTDAGTGTTTEDPPDDAGDAKTVESPDVEPNES